MPKTKKFNLYKNVERVNVYLWGKFVGAVALDPKLGYYVFAYDKSFGRSGIEVAPLHNSNFMCHESYRLQKEIHQ